ncbi:glycosyltransferase family 39 protein [Tardiphaga sp. 37S4]|uniref:ArnT family glycosyltransferase n=1 Tax=Tardiphaga sp. 37S4 TaxID=1404741 RepID=UPI001E3E84D4|nr:glycosyltransferase family 39 protein [Tardiphaga sp. 37S4]UFS77362.1 glycosyltransferase family 39 protein [Tardiphaga sp. 37S4]
MTGDSASRIQFWHQVFRPGQWMLAKARSLDNSPWPLLWVAGLFLVQAIPATIIRASNLEEGRIIALARGAAEDGHWITPFIYGERFPERPVLLSWITGLVGEATGGVTLWSLRIPHLAFFLAGAFLVYLLVKTQAGKAAAIFGAFSWISMPLVAPKFINAEPEIVLSVLLFAAFYVWWIGTSKESMNVSRWLSVAVLVALAGLTKGPQPAAYFGLGVGVYLLLKDRKQIPAFLITNLLAGLVIAAWYFAVHQQKGDIDLWLAHSRLKVVVELDWWHDHTDFLKSIIVETLPASILIVPSVTIVLRQRRRPKHDLLLAALCYSTVTTIVLLLWPGGVSARYAMPATMTLAVICGLTFEQWRDHQARVVVCAFLITYLIYGGLIIRGWIIMPFWPHLFQQSQIAGRTIAAAVPSQQLLYVIGHTTDPNMLVYVRAPISAVTLDHLATIQAPAWAVLLPHERDHLAQKHLLLDIGEARFARTTFKIVRILPSG